MVKLRYCAHAWNPDAVWLVEAIATAELPIFLILRTEQNKLNCSVKQSLAIYFVGSEYNLASQ